VLHDEHLGTRGVVREIGHPEFGPIRVPGLPLRLHGTDGPAVTPAPGPGSDAEAVLEALGLSTEEIEALRDEGVV
jgi:crotonobetainyl-CoA:carnitine CoA-transferase CaiB-like acyl-CoA transferase